MNEVLTRDEVRAALRVSTRPIAIVAVLALAVVVAMLQDQPWLAIANAPVAACAAAAAVIDARTRRIPRQLVYLGAALGAPLLVVATAIAGTWGDIARAAAGGLIIGGCFLVLVLISPRSLGMGDVRLATLLAMFAGYLSWTAILAIAVLPSLLALPAAIAGLVRRRREAIALGPYLLAAYLLILAAHP